MGKVREGLKLEEHENAGTKTFVWKKRFQKMKAHVRHLSEQGSKQLQNTGRNKTGTHFPSSKFMRRHWRYTGGFRWIPIIDAVLKKDAPNEVLGPRQYKSKINRDSKKTI